MKTELDDWLNFAYSRGASDIHLSAGTPPTYRLHGDLFKIEGPVILPHMTEEITKEILTEEQYATFLENGELDFSYSIPNISRFRVNAYRQRSSVSIAFRAVPPNVPRMEDLKLPTILTTFCQKPQGLVLVVGPTGSGKSTTLASMINYINLSFKKHIITLEDPIEYLHRHQNSIIDQREVGYDTQNFTSGLRAALRQDPDIILVGELRDLDTIQTAITAAETGHLVFATLHTSDAPSTIDRIIDVFPPGQQAQIRIQLASELVAVISQRLFPTPHHDGRRAALEIMINNPAIQNLIRNEKVYQIPSVIQTSRAQGMQNMENAILDLLKEGAISREAALPYLKGGVAVGVF
ncbi:type IV pilus twitching motility protein PilT [Pullulanibacillus sp. KACC 23026]|uniref:type IV pilus twitching motility protein PilT n=1 Tax=Pullulanibacillus sp. KACC 23026 TaxID=3028315 RepID=UPI0023AFC775|nr:type IV pilus twitching motility protein PilT [Pullulanibacillus sp. KACC 23026]WEG11459.1 type IV pilus twitching motility protein PilT [Pullulanibacillus sp. KACC 23026]